MDSVIRHPNKHKNYDSFNEVDNFRTKMRLIMTIYNS